jgi:putative peptidoglycan lipid II flippase
MSVMTLLSRLFGYLRDNLLAQMLGASRSADAFIIAFRIPNLFRRLVGEGAFTAAFIPTLSEYARHKDRRALWQFVGMTFWIMALILMIITALGVIFSPLMVRILAYGFAGIEEKWDLTVALNRMMFPYLVFIGLAALVQGVLNVHGSFGVPAFTPVLLNLSIIGAALIFAPAMEEPAWAFAWGVLLGGLLQLGFQMPFVMRLGMAFRPRFRLAEGLREPGVRQIGRLMLPGLFGMGVVQFTILVDSLFASLLPEGSVSALYYSGRVNELALGGFVISLSTVILPSLSRYAAEGRIDDLRAMLLYGLRVVEFITIPAALGLILLRERIIAVLFERGRFGPEDTQLAAHALLYYSVGLFSFAAVKVLAPAFFSQKDTRTPAIIAAWTLGLHVCIVWPLSRVMAHAGIALADSLSATFNMIALLTVFGRRHGLQGAGKLMVPAVRLVAAGLVMAALALPVAGWADRLCAGAPLAGALALGLTIMICAATYLLLCHALGSGETREIAAAILPRRRAP